MEIAFGKLSLPKWYACLNSMISDRCFPHVINIAVKAGVKLLTKAPPETSSTKKDAADDSDNDDDDEDVNEDGDIDYNATIRTAGANPALQRDPAYAAALLHDPISIARKLVKSLRSSFGRRQGLRDAIAEGNASGTFTDRRKITHAELLRDVDTRWSSMYFMIDRFIEVYPGVRHYIDHPNQKGLRLQGLNNDELRVLLDIRQFLSLFHGVQMTLSHERTPTLSTTIPTYEFLLALLRANRTILPPLVHAINESIARLEKYVNKARQTHVYALAIGMSCFLRTDSSKNAD